MNLSKSILLAWTLLSPLILGHSYTAGLPRLFGRRNVEDLRARIQSHNRGTSFRPASEPVLKKRANTDGQCGPGYGSCATGYCCSPAYVYNLMR
jgi:hypothetical protein